MLSSSIVKTQDRTLDLEVKSQVRYSLAVALCTHYGPHQKLTEKESCRASMKCHQRGGM